MAGFGMFYSIVSLALATTLVACSSGSGDDEGAISVGVTDAPIDDVESVWIEFTGVSIKPASGDKLDFDFDQPRQIDLLALQGDESELLLNNEPLPAGNYNWIRLKVNAEFDGIMDSYVWLKTGSQEDLQIPSGSQSGLKLNRGFTVAAGDTTSLTIDFDLRKSLTEPSGQPGYKLRPTLRLVDNNKVGSIRGTVDTTLLTDSSCSDADIDTGNVVYLFSGENVTPDDIDDGNVEPITTALVKLNPETGDYEYRVGYLTADTYTVAFTCQGDLDDPETDDTFQFVQSSAVTVSVGQAQTKNFIP